MTTRAGWEVTKIYEHYAFKQDTFKRDFVVMNQNARKTAKTKVEKDFYKLLNNSNFGNDCRNNIGNCNLELIYDGPEELADIKRFTNVFSDQNFTEFFTDDVLKKHVENEFEQKLQNLDVNDEFYPAMLENITEKNEELEAVDALLKKRRFKSYFYTKKLDSIEKQIEDSMDLRKNKMMIEFNNSESSAIKHIAVKSQNNIQCSFHVWKVINVRRIISKIFYLFFSRTAFISRREPASEENLR